MELTDLMIGLKEGLEYFSIKLCEGGFPIFEEDGLCKHPSDKCKYCEAHGDTYLCKRKTYTTIPKPIFNFA